MPLFPQLDENAIFLSREDSNHLLSSYSKHAFFLDDAEWPSVAHYFHAMKFEDESYREKIRSAPHPKKAKQLGRTRLKKIRNDWKEVRTTIMTRAIYIKCKAHDEVAEELLETEDRDIIENNSYDYFWGCGRDRRGENHYGKVLMNVRKKLRDEIKAERKAKEQASKEENNNG